MRVSLSNSDRSFSAAPDRPVLDAALDAGLRLAHSCRSGNCGSCRARLVGGAIDYPQGRPLGLSDGEIADGYVLLCQARAQSDLELELHEIRRADEALIKRLPCRVERAERLAHDVTGLHLRLPAVEEFKFEAGQYIDVLLSGGRRRSFSIASPPHDSKLLELHVRRVEGGEFSARIFAADPLHALLSIEGPHGRFFYRPPEAVDAGEGAGAAPLLLVGGGTGYAPLNSLLRTLVERSARRDITLYWGVRAERDLYADAQIRELQSRSNAFAYVPVLSETVARLARQARLGARGRAPRPRSARPARHLCERPAADDRGAAPRIRRARRARIAPVLRLVRLRDGFARAPAQQLRDQILILRGGRAQQRCIDAEPAHDPPDAIARHEPMRALQVRAQRGARAMPQGFGDLAARRRDDLQAAGGETLRECVYPVRPKAPPARADTRRRPRPTHRAPSIRSPAGRGRRFP